MTVFSAIQSAMIRTVGEKPLSAYTEQRGVPMEMAELANDVARDIIASHEWQVLLTSTSFQGAASSQGVPLPLDYDRMPKNAYLDNGTLWIDGLRPIRNLSEWQSIQRDDYFTSGGHWIMYGGRIHVLPTSLGAVSYVYLSRNYALSDDGTPKMQFDADTDIFRLDERLLTLGLIWRWKAQKGLEYAEDLATYETALSQAQTRDGGAHVVTGSHRVGWPINVARPLVTR